MRKLVLVLFLAMLPLQWSAAAVAALCLPGAQAMRSVQADALARADGIDHVHAQALASAGGSVDHHHGTRNHGHDDKAPHADHGGCCHAASSVLPPRFATQRPQAAPDDLVARMTVLTVSHFSENPFRPPRLALA